MAGDVEMNINIDAFLKAMEKATDKALEIIAGKIENYAITNVQGLRNQHGETIENAPELSNSITSQVKDGVVQVGSNMQIAPYIELGTGPMYQSPPEYMENNARGGKGQAGLPYWIYYDAVHKEFKVGVPVAAKPFLRPAIENHLDEYQRIIDNELHNAEE